MYAIHRYAKTIDDKNEIVTMEFKEKDKLFISIYWTAYHEYDSSIVGECICSCIYD